MLINNKTRLLGNLLPSFSDEQSFWFEDREINLFKRKQPGYLSQFKHKHKQTNPLDYYINIQTK